MVAFANSVAPGDTAKIFIGESDDGTAQGVTNTDSIQKAVVKEAEKIYPEIYYRTEVYEREGKRHACRAASVRLAFETRASRCSNRALVPQYAAGASE